MDSKKEKYLDLYHKLKTSYVPGIKKIWKERTDPDKFIHEDVGIAAYLINLWDFKDARDDDQHTKRSPPNFVDIGCGNGLLTYLLTVENYEGFGFDVRARKIWKSFQPQPKLLVSSFSPREESNLFKTCDEKTWLIGNHPDELTPWIPILARKYRCNFFIIPCCSYDFMGKYKREADEATHGISTSSIYSSYLQYVQKIALDCGFIVVIDKLRIPSTKRTSLIGRLDEAVLNNPILNKKTLDYCQEIIDKYSDSSNFQARCPVEPVRNCTKIGNDNISSIVKILFDYLTSDLDPKNNVLIHSQQEKLQKLTTITESNIFDKDSDYPPTVPWNAGKQNLKIENAVKLLPTELRQQMKAQHGGFQTLIRNHGHIFRFVDGYIRLRQPAWKDIESVANTSKIKTKRFYLYDHHPDKCPLPAQVCRFIH